MYENAEKVSKSPDFSRNQGLMVGEGGFEPPKSLTTDLQSAPFGHSGIPPYTIGAGRRTRTPDLLITNQLLYQLSYTSISASQPATAIIANDAAFVNRNFPVFLCASLFIGGFLKIEKGAERRENRREDQEIAVGEQLAPVLLEDRADDDAGQKPDDELRNKQHNGLFERLLIHGAPSGSEKVVVL